MATQPPQRPVVQRPNVVNGRIQFKRLGLARAPWADLYHEVLVMRWSVFLALTGMLYGLTHAVFASLYLAGGDCYGAGADTGPMTAFFFSVQTLTTIGYGTWSPTTPWAHAVVTLEAFVGVMSVGLFSGLCFAKFGRPTARMRFAERAVITLSDGLPTLMVRVANERNANIIAARVRLYALLDVVTEEGHSMRRFFPLRPVRDETPVFAMSWQIMHVIDEDSVLFGLVHEGGMPQLAAIVVSVTGTDATFMQTVHGQSYYSLDELMVGHRYVDIMTESEGMLAIDHGKLDDTVPDPTWPR
jgi:inward rectifier potassium channel